MFFNQPPPPNVHVPSNPRPLTLQPTSANHRRQKEKRLLSLLCFFRLDGRSKTVAVARRDQEGEDL